MEDIQKFTGLDINYVRQLLYSVNGTFRSTAMKAPDLPADVYELIGDMGFFNLKE